MHLVTNHSVDDVRVVYRECRSLIRAGYNITLVAPDDSTTPLPEVPTVLVPLSTGRFGRMVWTQLRVLRAARRMRPALVHIHDPELLFGAFLLRLLGYRIIYDVHEDMPKVVMNRSWIHDAVRPALSRSVAAVEWLAGRTFAGIVTTVPSIQKRFPENRSVLVQNFPELTEITTAGNAIPYEAREAGLVCWAGPLTADRGALVMAEAIAKVSHPQVHLEVAGNFDPPVIHDQMVGLTGQGRITARGILKRPEVLALYDRARIGLMLYQPTPSYVESQPIKLFECMAAGIPVVASDFPFIREVLQTHQCGIVVDPTNPAEAAEAIDYLLSNPAEAAAMGVCGRHAAESFTWESQFEGLHGVRAGPRRLTAVRQLRRIGKLPAASGVGDDHRQRTEADPEVVPQALSLDVDPIQGHLHRQESLSVVLLGRPFGNELLAVGVVEDATRARQPGFDLECLPVLLGVVLGDDSGILRVAARRRTCHR